MKDISSNDNSYLTKLNMLKVNYYDGFTAALMSFDVVFTEHACEITHSSSLGEVSDKKFSISIEDNEFDLLSILAALYTLDGRYERPIDELGSITCTFEWGNKICSRYFSGYRLNDCTEVVEDKKHLRTLDELLLSLISTIQEKFE